MNHRKLISLALALALALSLAVPVLAADPQGALPAKFDLRDENLVSSVKDQAPFGTCWGFAATAASEISILAELRELSPAYAEYFADPDNLDLSEHQLAWFAFQTVTEDENPAQAGEGRVVYGMYPMDAGGQTLTATSVFGAGTGPVAEELAPYQNKEGRSAGAPRDYYLLKKDDGGYYDWSLDEDLHFAASIGLTDTHILTSPAGKDEEGNYVYDPAGTLAIKQELMAKRGVTIFYHADVSRPEQVDEEGQFINTDTYAQYTYSQEAGVNHAVCIVGWDDNYPKENFLEGHQPPADGAWIVKNSWGSVNSKPHHVNDWGVDGTGYFYLSYYDKTITYQESFDFDVEHFYNGDDSYYVLRQHDYMPAAASIGLPLAAGSRYASVFNEDEVDQYVRAISVMTPVESCTAAVQVYLLNDGWKDPTDGTLLSSATKTYPYAGFHRIDLDKDCYIPAGADYSVVVGMTGADGSSQIPVSFGLGWGGEEAPEEGSFSVAVVNPGESFIYTGDGETMVWADWTGITQMVAEMAAAEEGGALPENTIIVVDNPPVKAYGELARDLEITVALANDEEEDVDAGDALRFTVTVKNPEKYEIKSIHLEDSLLDLGDNAFIEKLDAGESVTFDASYTLTREDMDIGNVVQLLTASLEYDKHLYSGGGMVVYLKDTMPWYADSVANVGVILASEWGKNFLPAQPVTRGDFVQALYLLGGNEAEGAIVPFTDVAADSDLADAVAWAAACGLAVGFGDGTFRPDVAINREQMATLMYRYIQALDMGYTGTWMFPLDYPDAGQVSSWANEAMHWMVQNEIIQGTPNGLEPKAGATMSQYCTILDRFIQSFNEA